MKGDISNYPLLGCLMTTTRQIDWLSATVLNIHHKLDVIKFFQSLGVELQPKKRAFHGYNQSLSAWSDTISVSWHDEHSRMGVHVQVTGDGLRYMESLGVSACAVLAHLRHRFQARATRIDVALQTDCVTTREVFDHAACGNWRGSPHKAGFQGSFNDEGLTVSFGSRQSEQYLRVYNKTAEQNLNDGIVRTRFEYEFKGKKAESLASLVACEEWGKVIGACRNMIQFIDSKTSSNISRCKELPWFQLLMQFERHKLPTSQHIGDAVQRTYSWIKTQVAPMLSALIDADMLSETLELVVSQRYRQNSRHKELKRIFAELKRKPDLLGLNQCWWQPELFPVEKNKFKKNPHLVLTSAFQLR